MAAQNKSSILLVYTGGTIGMRTDPETGTLVPFDFNDIHEEFPNLKYLDVDIELMPFEPIDSSNVTPALWVSLAEIIRDRYAEFDGFVILHGTDTMSYTASALSFMIENLDKPVVFTGSQIPIGVMRTDGRKNLITAIEIAAAKRAGKPVVPEVSLYFNNRLFRANRTTKFSAEELDAFHSENFPPLADIGVNIVYNTNYIHRPAMPTETLRVHTEMVSDVMILRVFPGLTREVFSSMMNIPNLKGIVMETYGAGNAPTSEWFINILSDTIRRGVPVINVTQCPSGSVSMGVYQTGISLQNIGVISGGDMTTEAALTKLMYLLGCRLHPDEIARQLNISIRGEITR